MTVEQLTKLREVLGAGEDLTLENAMSRIEERIKAAAEEKAGLDKQITDLTASVKSLEAKAVGKEAPKVDPDVLDGLAESAEERIDGLVGNARITPAVAASLKALLVGEAGKRNAYALSRTMSGTPESLVKGVLKALADNDPVKLGEQTRSQAIVLGRNAPGDDKDHDPETTKEMIAMAGGAAKA